MAGSYQQPACFTQDCDLESYINDQLRPTREFHAEVGEYVDAVIRELHGMAGLSVKEVFKGGSLGKGTAIRDRVDVDLVIFLNDVKTQEDLQANIPRYLERLQEYFHRGLQIGSKFVIVGTSATRHAVEVSVAERTRFQQLTAELQGGFTPEARSTRERLTLLKMDLLPAHDNLAAHASLSSLYEYMGSLTPDARAYCSSSLSRLQRDFVKDFPPNLKNLILLFKHWLKTLKSRAGSRNMLQSYSCELLAFHGYQRAGCPTTFDMRAAFASLMKRLVDHQQIDVVFEKKYNFAMIRGSQAQSGRPRLMDPANPYNNLLERVTLWEVIARYAMDTLRSPTLRGVTPDHHSWKKQSPQAQARYEETGSFQIFVKDANNKTHTVDVRAADRTIDLKIAMKQRTGVPPDQQRLLYGGHQLEDQCTLSSYHIQKGSTVHMMLRLRGGPSQ